MYVMRQVRPKTNDESFLSSLIHVDGGDAARVIHRVLNSRNPMVFFTHDKYTVYVSLDAQHAVLDIVKTCKAQHAAFGEIDGQPFVIVPYSKDRLVKNLIATAKKFRSIKSGLRLIETEADLTNNACAGTIRRDRAYKDDE